jgi:asparagine synthase (glutamine-hydrolysing)
MCGIVGIWNYDGQPVDERRLIEARDTMIKRGPDDSGLWVAKNIGFAHRRLSIIDLSSGGHQPMVSKDGSTAIVFNGEIYNFKDVRDDLEKDNVKFSSKSDTEVLLEGYMKWGPAKLFRRCRGMWAIAIWDGRSRKIVLARDRFGKKPLFFKNDSKKLIFASTLNAVRNLSSNENEIDEEALDEFVNIGYVPVDKCILKKFFKCQPSTFIEFSENGGVTERKYWDIDYEEDRQISKQEWLERVEYLLKEAVKDRLVSDVPVSAFLSGGLDSTLIVALMCELGYNPKTFTMAVPGSWRDESKRAKLVADKYGTDHTEIPLDPDCVKALPYLVYEFGEPYADSSAIPAFYVSKIASQHTKVILTGDGGDEVFGGYGRLSFMDRFQRWNEGFPSIIKMSAFKIGDFLDNHKLLLRLRTADVGRRMKTMSGGLGYYFDLWLSLPAWRRRALYGPRFREIISTSPDRYFFRQLKNAKGNNWMHRLLKTDLKTTLVGDFLTKIDTSCMACSIEGRSPFLDHRLIGEVWKMPVDMWQYNGETKGFLKLIAAKYLPEELLSAPKHGFSIPVEDFWEKGWYKLANEILMDGYLVKDGWIVKKALKSLCVDLKNYKMLKDSLSLYHLLCLEMWIRIMLKNESPSCFDLKG